MGKSYNEFRKGLSDIQSSVDMSDTLRGDNHVLGLYGADVVLRTLLPDVISGCGATAEANALRALGSLRNEEQNMTKRKQCKEHHKQHEHDDNDASPDR